MLLAFEGTGMQVRGGTSPKGLNNLSHTTSFVWNFYWKAKDDIRRYFPGPNVQGSNCDDIFKLAREYYRDLKKNNRINDSTPINLVGYSRGAYIAMCFAQYLKINGVSVNFLGMFDAVSIDMTIDGIISTKVVPNNVKYCYHVVRSRIIGSRNVLMNGHASKYLGDIGIYYEDDRPVKVKQVPGSHAAVGGFPNEAGIFDSPTPGQGDPDRPGYFHPRKEITAAWEAGNFMTEAAYNHHLFKKDERLVPAGKPKEWLPETEWYRPQPIKHYDYNKSDPRKWEPRSRM